MTFAKEIVCPRCDNRFRLDQLLNLCSCGSPLLVRYDLRKAAATVTKPSLQGRSATLWRYRELLPVQDDVNVVSLGEGFTPLLEAKTVAHELSLRRVWIKDEAQNPTGSFKDRGLCLAVSRAKELGVKKIAIPSAGNAGGSLSAYAARAGISANNAAVRLHRARQALGRQIRRTCAAGSIAALRECDCDCASARDKLA
jgi:threonine synthase